ncbi:hypothetical protein THAPSDRAFT_261325, partial [Thalassiosira pseudonana CCMP1335]
IKMEAARALSLLSSAPENIVAFDKKVLPSVIVLLQCEEEETGRDGAATISNAASNAGVRAFVGKLGGVPPLIGLLDSPHKSCQTNACRALCQLSLLEENKLLVFHHDGLSPLIQLCSSASQSHAAMILCNLTSHDGTQDHVARQFDLLLFVELMNDASVECQAYATMAICNLASKQTHGSAIMMAGGGGLQAAVLALKDEDPTTMRFACICLANMANDSTTQSQIVVHGGLPSLVSLSVVEDNETRDCALMCLSNLAANESNHSPLMKQGVLKGFVDASASDNLHAQCLALSSIRRLSLLRDNQERLVMEGIVQILVNSCKTTIMPDIQREIASCFCNLTLTPDHRLDITRVAISELVGLTKSDNLDTVRLSLCAMGNLAEDVDTHT